MLTDQTLLAAFVKNVENGELRWEVVKKINDQTLLTELAKNDPSSAVRQMATLVLTDQTLLLELAENDKDHFVSSNAKNRLKYLRGGGLGTALGIGDGF